MQLFISPPQKNFLDLSAKLTSLQDENYLTVPGCIFSETSLPHIKEQGAKLHDVNGHW